MDPGRHLDATGDREVVYCHSCRNEWYRDDGAGLQCPLCDSEATEIVRLTDSLYGNRHTLTTFFTQVSPDEDPRDILPEPANANSRSWFSGPGYDSDPDEEDIEEHLTRDPNGFLFRQNIDRNRRPGSEPPIGDRPPQANDGDFILNRFRDMLTNDFGVHRDHHGGLNVPNMPQGVRQTTFMGPGYQGTSATFTFSTGPMRGGSRGGPGMVPGMGFDEYDDPPPPRGFPAVTVINIRRSGANPYRSRLFNGMMGGPAGRPTFGSMGGLEGAGPPGVIFASNLHELLNQLINPRNAVMGDAVYSQEALDRIITQLMEANPQSNAAPPASQAAIEKLPHKQLDEEMIGPDGKAECTICMDDMSKGDEVAVLPCKHWFHPDCVTLWLKEHNTCPVCRTSIESQGNANANGSVNGNASSSSHSQGNFNVSHLEVPGNASSSSHSHGTSRDISIPTPPGPRPPSYGARPSIFAPRSSFTSRDASSSVRRRNQERLDAIRANAEGRPSSFRRNSLSPPSPGLQPPASEYGSRTRARSPEWSRTAEPDHDQSYSMNYGGRTREPSSHSGRQSNRRQSQDDGGNGPVSWLRNQWNSLSRPSGSGSGGGSGANGGRGQ
jgi:hypothetical protein